MKKNLRLLLTGVAVAASVLVLSATSAMAATTKVTADECRVRASASTSAEVAFTVKQGTELEILSKTEPGDGYTWYEVKNGGQTGFIRSDLVATPSDDSAGADEPAAATSEGSAGDASSPSTATSESQAIAGVVSADTVTVRSGASTSTSKAGSAKSGQEVAISGEAMDADGYTWYQVSFVANDKAVEGFIRADFLEVTQYAEPEVEEPVAEEPTVDVAPAPVINNDYEVIFETNSEGVDEWFLYDHIKGTKQSINNIYAVMQQSQDYADEDNSTIKTLKIVVIVMSVLLVGLIVAVVILLLKLRDTYEDYPDMDETDYDSDYEDESYGYEEEEDDEEEEIYEKPKRRVGFGSKKPRRIKKSYDFDDEDDEDDEDDDYVKPTRRSLRQEAESDNTWSTSGMLDIDDDMEFEFLDIDN